MLATISWTLVLTVDTLCISNILNDAALVGYYGVAIMMTRGLMIIPGAITQTAFPYLSERSDNFSEIWKQLWRVGKRVALIMGFVCVVVFVLAHWIVTLFFGKEYLPSVSALQVLAPGTFVYSLLNVSGNTYVALGRTDVSLYITIMSGIFNVVMNILLIKHLGMIGAAWATVFTYIFTLTMESFWWWNFYNRGRIYS
jgi:O-antigen/teichoic acid export membrane protein